MATNQYYNAGFNPLAAEDMESLSIQTENAGFHEIKIYNNTKDKLWELSDMLNIAASLPDVVLIGKNLQNLLVRADTVWEGIKEGANKKRVKLKIQGNEFIYMGEMLERATKIKRYIKMYEDGESFISTYKETPEDFIDFKDKNTSTASKASLLREKIQEQVALAAKEWGKLAALINLNMPLVIKEERNIFFR